MAKTALTIRVQARGGKFLADDIGGAAVTVREVRTGELLASGVTRGDSGTLVDQAEVTPDQIRSASKHLVVTPGTSPTVNWLVPTAGQTSAFVAELDLEESTEIEVSAFGALGGLQSAHRVTTSTWVAPGDAGPSEPGFVVEIPGLLVQVLEPTIHTELGKVPAKVPLRAVVAMMCGCPIADGEAWLPGDFEVVARIRNLGTGVLEVVPLTFDAEAGVPGLFQGSFEVCDSGDYQVTVVAVQRSTGNTGSGAVTVFTKPS